MDEDKIAKMTEKMNNMVADIKESQKNILEDDELFIPCTKETHITNDIVWRPIRSWHQCTFAGEGLYKHRGDGSGCLMKDGKKEDSFIDVCMKPKSVTHRIYWHKCNPEFHVSSFLSYPDGMSSVDEYHWELYPVEFDNHTGEVYEDCERFIGDDAEVRMEEKVVSILNKKYKSAVVDKIRGEQKGGK